MDFRFNAHDPRTGAFLYTLPRPSQAQIGDVFGERGTLELTYSAKQARAVNLPTFLEVQAQVQFDGGAWENVGPALIRLGGSHEDTDQAGMRTVQFVGREWLLVRARVGAGDLPLIDGKRPFYQASAGQIIRSLLLEAQDRGAADGIELGPFTNTTDSAGNTWSERVTIYYSPGLPIGDVLANLVEQGVCDYRMEGRTLHVYEPETTLGRDMTTSNNPVRVHGAVTEAPVKYSLEDLANSALLIGEDGFQVEVNNPSAPDDYGRLEVTIEQGGVNQEGTARTLIDAELQRGSREIREITRTQHAAAAHALPYRDYRAGDYVQAFDDGQWVRYRVREIQVVRDAGGWTVHTVLNDRLQELLLSLAKKTNGIVNGSRGSGGDGTRPAPPQKPGVEPTAPQGLVIDQQVYLDNAGTARGVITAGWGEVTESTAGLAIDIGGYELWWRENSTFATWTLATSTSGDTSVDQSPVVLTAGDGSAMEYQWRVRAVAQVSNRPGPWSNIVTLTMTQDTTPPPPPSAPIVETGFRIVTVEWDGLDEDGQQMPRDFSRVRIYLAAAEDMVNARLAGSLAYPGSWNSETMPADVPVWVAMSAVDRVGNESTLTPAVSVTPRQLVDDEKIREELDGIDDTIQDAVDDLQQEIDNIVVDDLGTTTYQTPYEPDETTDPAPKAGDLWFDTSNGMKLHRHDGQGWVSAADERVQTIQDAQSQLEADIDTVRTSVDGKSRITQSTSTPPSQYDGAVGDRWERMSSMGSGGSLVSNWRWNGDVWVSTIISDAVLGNVDAAKIGTGYLDANRIKAGTIQTDMLAVGVGGNLLYDPKFLDPEVSATRLGNSGWTWRDRGGRMCFERQMPTPASNSSFDLTDPSGNTEYVPVSPGVKVVVEVEALGPVDIIPSFRYADGVVGVGSAVADWGAEMRVVRVEINPDDYSSWATGAGPSHISIALRQRHSVAYAPPGTWTRVFSARIAAMSGATVIEGGAITTDKIAVGAITSDSGIFGRMDAGILNAGEIDAARIGADTITADKLLIGGAGNLIADPTFSSPSLNATRVSRSSSNALISTSGLLDGSSGALRLTAPGGQSALTFVFLGAHDLLHSDTEVMPGQEYSLRAWCTVAYLGSVRWRFTANVTHSDGSIEHMPATAWANMSQSGWHEASWVAPAGVASVSFRIQASPDGSSGAWVQWEQPSLRPRVGATLIEDGAITTDKILANAITAGKIAALAIEADHIAANAVDADKIRAGAIDGKIITGATVRTSASGARVQLTATGLRSYDSSGSQTFSINATNGAVEMTGNLRQQNSQGTITVGPELFSGVTPSIRFTRSSEVNSSEAGLTMEQSGALLMYGSRATNSRQSSLQLARGASTSSTGIYRWFSGSQTNSYVSLTSDGDAYVSSSGGDAHLRATTSSSTSATAYVRAQPDGQLTMAGAGGSSYFRIRSDEILQGYGIWRHVMVDPLQSIVINNSGHMGIYGSSRRWKQDIEKVDPSTYEDGLLSLDVSSWLANTSVARSQELAEWRAENPMAPVPEEFSDAFDVPPRQVGMIAEDVADAGLEPLVGRDEYGLPRTIVRENFGMMLVPIIKRLRDRVDALETKLGATP